MLRHLFFCETDSQVLRYFALQGATFSCHEKIIGSIPTVPASFVFVCKYNQ